MKLIHSLFSASALFLLSGCFSNPADELKKSVLPEYSRTLSVGQALEGSTLCRDSKREWLVQEDSKGRVVVDFRCTNPRFRFDRLADSLAGRIALAMMGGAADVLENPVSYYQAEISRSPQKWRDRYGSKAVDAVLAIDARSMRTSIKFAERKDEAGVFECIGAFIEYDSPAGVVSAPLAAHDDVLRQIYEDGLVYPNIPALDEALGISLSDALERGLFSEQ